MCSIIVNYTVGNLLGNKKLNINRKGLLIIGILFNVLLLGYFKYTDFLISNINYFTSLQLSYFNIILPLGISFFTFTQTAYLVDSYKHIAKEYNFINYSLFVTFYPHLLAGPIIHHKEMMPQFDYLRNKRINYKNLSTGILLFVIGLFKKEIVADTLRIWANYGFDVADKLNLIEAWVTSLTYTLQLYFDFSGYTDMALGSALMFNIRLPINFNSPYKALDIQDFWRRWHITLSRFLRDYIYIPLGGNRTSDLRVLSNLMATFLIGGLWHGAGWTFVFWGFLHGTAIVIHRLWKNINITMPKLLSWFITFNFVNIAWIFFRAKDRDEAIKVLRGMLGVNGIWGLEKTVRPTDLILNISYLMPNINIDNRKNILLTLFISFFLVLFARNSNQIVDRFHPNVKTAFLISIVMIYCLLNLNKVSEFIYFNF